MTDVDELRKVLDASGYKLRFVAEKCGLTYQGFLPKMKGESEFTQTEILTLKDLLHLSNSQVQEIFLSPKIDETSSTTEA